MVQLAARPCGGVGARSGGTLEEGDGAHEAHGRRRYEDKWLFKIRLKSWLHSIRANRLTKWNESIDKIKLFRHLQISEPAHSLDSDPPA